jgi:hypothetical protein
VCLAQAEHGGVRECLVQVGVEESVGLLDLVLGVDDGEPCALVGQAPPDGAEDAGQPQQPLGGGAQDAVLGGTGRSPVSPVFTGSVPSPPAR